MISLPCVPLHVFARDPKRLERILDETRRGYATRDPNFVGGSYNRPPFDDGLAAIVVPLRDRKRVHGSINILFVKTAYTVQQFAASISPTYGRLHVRSSPAAEPMKPT